MSTDWLVDKIAQRAARAQEQRAALDAEIRRTAAIDLESMRAEGKLVVGPHLRELVLERLCLDEIIAAESVAVENARERIRIDTAYSERVLKPIADADAKRKREAAEYSEHAQRVSDAFRRCREGKHDAADVELLRRNTSYRDRYVVAGRIEQWLHDNDLFFEKRQEE